MRRTQIGLGLMLAVPIATAVCGIAQPAAIVSPDGKLHASLMAKDDRLYYSLERENIQVLRPSPLGITVDGKDLGTRVRSVRISSPEEVNYTYPTRGVHSMARNHYLEYSVRIVRSSGTIRDLEMVFRAFNDGLAYRYSIPGEGKRTVTGEASAWHFPAGTPMWFQPNTRHYEGMEQHDLLGEVETDIGPPVTLKIAADQPIYVTVTEAALLNYSGMTLEASKGSPVLESKFLDDGKWQVPGGKGTPWRVTMATTDLDQLVNTDILTNLCPPPSEKLYPKGLSTDWIQPGRFLWRWWSRGAANPTQQKKFVDFAAKLGLEYTYAGWMKWEDWNWKTLQNVVDYADQKGVKLWAWRPWKEIRDRTFRREFFENLHRAGVVGIKIDYMNKESQHLVNFYTAACRDAAREHLMINFHGAHKPTGTRRTYPNEISREAVRGLEYNKFDGKLPPSHNATLPFTRFLAGPADYTPVTFNPGKLGATTVAHQLATAIVFTCPALHFSEYPAKLLGHRKALDVLKNIPACWDQTMVLECSRIGHLVAMARRRGNMWFLAVLNGSRKEGRMLHRVNLSFLGPGSYRCVSLGDAGKTEFSRRADVLEDASSKGLDVHVSPGGGFVAMLTPVNSSR